MKPDAHQDARTQATMEYPPPYAEWFARFTLTDGGGLHCTWCDTDVYVPRGYRGQLVMVITVANAHRRNVHGETSGVA